MKKSVQFFNILKLGFSKNGLKNQGKIDLKLGKFQQDGTSATETAEPIIEDVKADTNITNSIVGNGCLVLQYSLS